MQVNSRGKMQAHRLFGVRELGLRDPESNLDRVIRVFLSVGEAIAARWIQMPNAILILQVVPTNPASGAIYVYHRIRQEFYLLTFEGDEDNLSLADFAEILSEYRLLEWSQNPSFPQVNSLQCAAA